MVRGKCPKMSARQYDEPVVHGDVLCACNLCLILSCTCFFQILSQPGVPGWWQGVFVDTNGKDRPSNARQSAFFPFTPSSMSTRCQIGFYPTKAAAQKDLNCWEALLYRHCDGYPSEALTDLIDFCRSFQEKRGMDDLECCAARALVFQVFSHEILDNLAPEIELRSLDRSPEKDSGPDSRSRFLKKFGVMHYGISDAFHCDLEYYYAVTGDGHILAYCGFGTPEDLELFFSVDINKCLRDSTPTEQLVRQAEEAEESLESQDGAGLPS